MKKCWGLILLLCCISTQLSAQTPYPNLVDQPDLFEELPESVLIFLNQYVPLAGEVAARSDVPVEFLLCVAGLETGWGRSELAKEANNLFGIKNPYEDGPSYCILHDDYYPGRGMVTQYDCFKKYESALTSFEDYLTHMEMKGCYLDIQEKSDSDFKDWVELVDGCGYATDPEYGQKLIKIRDKYSFLKLIPGRYFQSAQ